jgi:hypothetical protein
LDLSIGRGCAGRDLIIQLQLMIFPIEGEENMAICLDVNGFKAV